MNFSIKQRISPNNFNNLPTIYNIGKDFDTNVCMETVFS